MIISSDLTQGFVAPKFGGGYGYPLYIKTLYAGRFDLDAPKTSGLVSKLKDFDLGKRPLIVTEDASENLYLSARNLPYVEVRDVQGLDPVSLVGADSVLVTTDAVKKIEEWLA